MRLRPGRVFGYAALTLSRRPFQTVPLTDRRPTAPSFYPRTASTARVWAPPLSLATTRGITFVFSSCGYLDVSVPRVRLRLWRMSGLQPDGLPHSGVRGSQGACPSPRLFAACRALLRLREPRYPPSALLFFSSPPARLGAGASYCFSFPSIMSKIFHTVENKGLEPLTPCVQGRCSKPTELIPRPTMW